MTSKVPSTQSSSSVTISTGYKPREALAHLHLIFGITARFMTLVFHRRAGKTVFTVNSIIDHALRNPLPYPKYGYIAPSFKQAKNISWNYFCQYTKGIPGVEHRVSDLTIMWPRTWGEHNDVVSITLAGAENTEGLRGGYLDIFVLDEYSDIDPTILPSIFPSTSDRYELSMKTPGCPMSGLGIILGTPKGQDHFYKMFEMGERAFSDEKGNPLPAVQGKFFSQIMKASESGILSKDELSLQKAILGDFLYNQEFECSFAVPREGVYFAEQLEQISREGRIGAFPHIHGSPIATFWDLGMSDATAIWFVQNIWGMRRIIHYEEAHGRSLEKWAGYLLKNEAFKDYTYGIFHFPHDIEVKDFIYGKKRSESLQEIGLYPFFTVPKLGPGKKPEGIHASRLMLNQCVFNDTPSVQKGLNALRNYRQEYDEKTRVYANRPKHDWTSHAADAFQTFACGERPSSYSYVSKSLSMDEESNTLKPYDELSLFRE